MGLEWLKKKKIDTAFGDENALKLRAALKNGNWQAVYDFINKIRKWSSRHFYCRVIFDSPGKPAWLDQVVKAHPNDSLSYTLRGIHSILWAWEARGSGYSESVSNDGWKLFHARLESARNDLLRAHKLDPKDPVPVSHLLTVCRGLGADLDDTQKVFNLTLSLDPENKMAHVQMLQFLCAKWYGSHEEMFTFARKILKSRPEGSHLHCLINDAHIEYVLEECRESDSANPFDEYFGRAEVQTEVIDAYYKSVGSSKYVPDKMSPYDYNSFAFSMILMKADSDARACFEKIGDNVTETPWGFLGDPLKTFNDLRKYAK